MWSNLGFASFDHLFVHTAFNTVDIQNVLWTILNVTLVLPFGCLGASRAAQGIESSGKFFDRSDVAGRYEQPQEPMPMLAMNSRWICLLLLGGWLCMAPLQCEAQNLLSNPGIEETESMQIFHIAQPIVQNAPGATNTEGLGRLCPTNSRKKMNKS